MLALDANANIAMVDSCNFLYIKRVYGSSSSNPKHIYSWDQGANAIVDVLIGKVNPSCTNGSSSIHASGKR